MKDGIIIQARTGSTRLHNKILLPFYGKQRIIDILIGNIKQACIGRTIVLATTNRPQDDILAEVAREAGICCYRGDEDNVLDRFIRASCSAKNVRKLSGRRKGLSEQTRIKRSKPNVAAARIKWLSTLSSSPR